MNTSLVLLGMLAYTLSAWVARFMPDSIRANFGSVLSLVFGYLIFFVVADPDASSLQGLTNFAIYIGLALVPWLALRLTGDMGLEFWVGIALPTLFLAFVKVTNIFFFVGISYASFRIISFAHEYSAGRFELPSPLHYLGFVSGRFVSCINVASEYLFALSQC